MYVSSRSIEQQAGTHYQHGFDMVPGDAVLLWTGEQDIDKVAVALLKPRRPGRMVVDELVEQLVPPPADLLGLGADDLAEQLDPRQPREVVVEVEASKERGVGVDELPEQAVPALLAEELAGDGAADEVMHAWSIFHG